MRMGDELECSDMASSLDGPCVQDAFDLTWFESGYVHIPVREVTVIARSYLEMMPQIAYTS